MMSIIHVIVLVTAFVQAADALQIGSISYWDKSSDYDSLPGNGLALINPNDGILSADTATIASFAKIINKLKSSKPAVTLLGYIATGYGDRTKQSFKTITDQVKSYFKNYPQLDGIFFDEIGYTNDDCNKAKTDVDALRKIVTGVKSNVVITWNPGWVGSNWCYINIANKGEIVMDFESDITTYTSTATSKDLTAALSKARSRGVLTWHAVHTAKTTEDMKAAIRRAKQYGADFIYVTNIGGDWQHGENTYGSPPIYWQDEIKFVPTV